MIVKRLTESELRRIVKRVINEQNEEIDDYKVATNFAREIEEWWEGSSNVFDDPEEGPKTLLGKNYYQFFSKYQGRWDDDDTLASDVYADSAVAELNKKVGKKNKYYKEIESWILEIADQIDDAFQNECSLILVDKENNRVQDFKVDPEIDVDGFYNLF
jgi:hypothetical protein